MEKQKVQCSTCKHEAHRAGDCKNCNCGQSELIGLKGERFLAKRGWNLVENGRRIFPKMARS